MKTILVISISTLCAVSAIAQTGNIAGRVTDETGRALAGVTIIYNSIPELTRDSKGNHVVSSSLMSARAVSSSNGDFLVADVPPALYHLCAVALSPGQIASCESGTRPQTVTVVAGASVNGVTITMGSGTIVNIHVLDAAGHVREGSRFRLGAIAANGSYQFAKEVRGTNERLEYQMTIPKNLVSRLVVDTKLPVTDRSGNTMPTGQPNIVLPTDPASPIDISLTVN